MTKIDISNDEIQALDIVLGKVEVKPIVGYKLATLRIKIQNALQAEQKVKVEKKDDGKEANRKTDKSNKK